MRVKIVTAMIAVILVTVPVFSQAKASDPEKIENIRHLIKLTRSEDMRDVMVNQFLDALKPMFSGGTTSENARGRQMFNRFSTLLGEEFRKIDFTSVSVALYDKYFTNDEIVGLIHFYETPVGQKAIQVLPQLVQESMVRGQEQGQQAASRAMARLTQEFPELRNEVPPVPTSR